MHSFDDEILLKNAKAAATPATERSGPVETRGPANKKSADTILRLQRKLGNAGVAQLMGADDDKQSVDNATRSGGQPLDSASRVQMESSFGTDFSSVRVHTGGDADKSAAQLGAHAYTVGENVVFAGGKYEPHTPTGERTLAHELTHVVQQRSGPVEGSDTGGGVKVSHPSDQYERAAEAKADEVIAGRMASESSPGPATDGGASVQREGEEEEEVQALAVQREGEEEEEVQTLAVQREGEEEEEVQALAVQREGEEEEEVQALAVQREGEEEEEGMSG
jgi:Domain of unknown function (DUF4157)